MLISTYLQISLKDSSKRPSQYSTRPVNEWSTQQVCHWLLGINMDHYAAEFMAKGIDGNQLLLLDSAKLKVSFLLADWV